MNTSIALPSLYISHGSPMMALEPGQTGQFLLNLGQVWQRLWGKPRAIMAVSPHTATHQLSILGGAAHQAIYDFGGFPAALYQERYDVAGDPSLAQDISRHLIRAGIANRVYDETGLDHGLWTVFKYLWPDRDIPVVPVSLIPSAKTSELWTVGQALAPLMEQGVMLVTTGSATHNLRRFMTERLADDASPTPDTLEFTQWIADRAQARDWPALLDYRRQAPHAVLAHPTDEHWLPFYIAAGGGGSNAQPERLFTGVANGVLAMDSYAFGPQATTLLSALNAAP